MGILGIFPGKEFWASEFFPTKATGVELPVESLVQRGIDRYHAGEFVGAIALWQDALSQLDATIGCESEVDCAVVYGNLARAYREIGQLDRAILNWQQAFEIYQIHLETPGASREAIAIELARLLSDRAQAYNELGQHQQAIELLAKAQDYVKNTPDSLTEAAIQGALGNAYWGAGQYKAAIAALTESLEISRNLQHSAYVATALNHLGNVYLSRSKRFQYQANVANLEGDVSERERLLDLAATNLQSAKTSFEQSASEAATIGSIKQVTALLNLNRVLARLSRDSTVDFRREIRENRDRALEILATAPDSRAKARALINIASSSRLSMSSENRKQLLNAAITVAQNLGDRRTESFALGSLGHLYEEAEDNSTAMELTRQAEFAAQEVQAAESLYRWEWQAARLFKAQGNIENAISAYNRAIATLQTIRSDILAANPDIQFDFRDAVEPVYRELIALLLNSSMEREFSPNPSTENFSRFSSHSTLAYSAQNQSKIHEALNILDSLKLAELRNFFGDDCVEVAQDTADNQLEADAAAIYSVILGDRTELILELPGNSQQPPLLKRYPIEISASELQAKINQFREFLEKRSTYEYITYAQNLYDILIRPLERDLILAQPKTLVFIHDGVLRKVPMAALNDGEKFLIQKYAIATTPSLSVTTNSSQKSRQLKALTLGLTVAIPPFSALNNVATEVERVNSILGGAKLLDEEFTTTRLVEQLEKGEYPIVHMATHGKFGVDSDNTFLLSFDSKITIEQIDNLLRSYRDRQQPVELLTLSACQTAAGDDRAALGIAGVAVRAGVETALATLWFINDAATVPLIEEFYTQLQQPNISKAQALQKAQIKMIDNLAYNHPAVWSPFILIGNWQ
ncbi:CHAT domain-containing protein [Phormidium sp. CCY1219]|uniref:CHAT domain-containing protein n=1 Tax=Phormidium sp. CCY1219 TaxID=2886104 RepID=UPI002D1F82D8|nr:CHAT domain-containing protein [Phormidium sp. CCY1219]MEB3827835.1 CHAT domain-containing protein [Phormidium sp. CCY1219]